MERNIQVSQEPFEEVIKDLKSVATNITQMIDPVTELNTNLYKVSGVVDDVYVFFNDVKILKNVVDDIKDICLLLSPVPIIDVVAEAILDFVSTLSRVLDITMRSLNPLELVIGKVKTILSKVMSGIGPFNKIITNVSQDAPTYTNTVVILNCLMKITDPIAQVLVDTEASAKLQSLVSTYVSVRDEVSSDALPFTRLLNEVTSILSGFVTELGNIVNEVASAIFGVVAIIKHAIESFLKPIDMAFKQVLNAIKPIKWAIDALACVFKALEKVITVILNETGLQLLINKLEMEIFKDLGIDKLLDDIAKIFNLDQITSYSENIDTSKRDSKSYSMVGHWTSLTKTLIQYSINHNQGTKELMKQLVFAMTNSSIDPNKPGAIPDWPTPPDFKSVNYSYFPLLDIRDQNYDQALVALDRIILNVKSNKYKKLEVVFHQATIPLNDNFGKVTTFKDGIKQLIEKLNTVIPRSTMLQSNLKLFQQSLQIPTTFATQVQILSNMFSFSKETLDFFGDVVFIKEISDILGSQQKELDDINKAFQSLVAAISQIAASVQIIVNNVPSQDVLTIAQNSMLEWGSHADSVARVIDLGEEQLQPQYKDDLAKYTNNLNSRCEEITIVVKDISQLTDDVLSSIDIINNLLALYSEALKTVTNHDNIISMTALPEMTKISDKVKILSSIFDPLQQVLQSLDCKDKENPIKFVGNTILQKLNDNGRKTVQIVHKAIIAALNALIAQMPINVLYQSIIKAQDTINSQISKSMNKQSITIATQLNALTGKLVQKYEFKYQDSTQGEVKVQTQFLSQEDVDYGLKILTMQQFILVCKENSIIYGVDPGYTAEIKKWTEWTQYMVAFDGFLGLIKTNVVPLAPQNWQNILIDSFYVVHKGVQNVDQKFLDGITMMKGDPKHNPPILPQKPSYEFPPSPVPDWPTDHTKANLLHIWEIVEGALKTLASKIPGGDEFHAIIFGLVETGEKLIQDLNKAFPQ